MEKVKLLAQANMQHREDESPGVSASYACAFNLCTMRALTRVGDTRGMESDKVQISPVTDGCWAYDRGPQRFLQPYVVLSSSSLRFWVICGFPLHLKGKNSLTGVKLLLRIHFQFITGVFQIVLKPIFLIFVRVLHLRMAC
jgi:hypothetical protein